MTNKRSSQEILSLFHERANNLMELADQLFFARALNLGLSTISATEFISQFDSQQKSKEPFSIERIEKSLDFKKSAEWIENWVRHSFNGKVIIEEISDLKFSDLSSYEKLDNDCRSLALLFDYLPQEKGFKRKSIKKQLNLFHTMDKKAIELINLGNRLIGYWMVEFKRRLRKKKNVMPRTKKRLQNETDIKKLLEKYGGVASRKMELEAMALTGLRERSVRDTIKKIRSLEPT